jgi:outer membrane protein
MKALLLTFLVLLPWFVQSQEGIFLPISLSEVVELSQSQTPAADLAKKSLQLVEWQIKAFQARLKPRLTFEATVPQRFRGIAALPLPDGREAFLSRSLMEYRGGFTVQQSIAATGGEIFLSTNFRRLDLFEPFNTAYLAAPINLGIQQTIFGFNALKWARQIEALKHREHEKRSVEALAEAAFQAAAYFFDVYEAQAKLETANQTKMDAENLLTVANQRIEAGKIALDEQIRIQMLGIQSESDRIISDAALQKANVNLQDFLGMATRVRFQPIAPTFLPNISVDFMDAILKASESGSLPVSLERRAVEAKMQVAAAKSARKTQVQLIAQLGLAQSTQGFRESYQNLIVQERASVGVLIPILDWGYSQANLEVAMLREKIESAEIEIARRAFEREIQLISSQLSSLRQSAMLAQEALQMARQVREISRNRYELGKIAFTDLQIAYVQEKNAIEENLGALRRFWLSFYALRKLTLFDFETGLQLPLPDSSD